MVNFKQENQDFNKIKEGKNMQHYNGSTKPMSTNLFPKITYWA